MDLYYKVAIRQKPEPEEIEIGALETKVKETIEEPIVVGVAAKPSLTISDEKVASIVTKAKIASSISTKAITVGRNLMAPPQIYEDLKNLTEQKNIATDKRQKTEINREIREIKKKNYVHISKLRSPRTIPDLNNNSIGQVFFSEKKSDEVGIIKIGDAAYINNFFFCFTVSGSNYFLRTTATLTDPGKDELKRYLKRYFKMSHKRKMANSSQRKLKRKPNRFFNQELKRRKAFNINIDGTKVHLNTEGKIEIFSEYNTKQNAPLVGRENLDGQQINRLMAYSRFTRAKKWIYETNNKTNSLIGSSVNTLAQVISEIFPNN